MLTLGLDVDGVLLDLDRGGRGPWTNELRARFGIEPALLYAAFFRRSWTDNIVGRRSVEDGLAEALAQIGTTADVESVLACWFDADSVPIAHTFELAQRATHAGARVVLATNQEHRRAACLHRRVGASFRIDRVIYSADVGYQKHDPTFFAIASELLGVDPSDRSTSCSSTTRAERRRRPNIRLLVCVCLQRVPSVPVWDAPYLPLAVRRGQGCGNG